MQILTRNDVLQNLLEIWSIGWGERTWEMQGPNIFGCCKVTGEKFRGPKRFWFYELLLFLILVYNLSWSGGVGDTCEGPKLSLISWNGTFVKGAIAYHWIEACICQFNYFLLIDTFRCWLQQVNKAAIWYWLRGNRASERKDTWSALHGGRICGSRPK